MTKSTEEITHYMQVIEKIAEQKASYLSQNTIPKGCHLELHISKNIWDTRIECSLASN